MTTTEFDFDSAVKRLREFKEQQTHSERLADEGSLERAHDLMAVLEDKRWAEDLPPVQKSHHRGRPVDPYGKSRLAKWIKEHVGFHPSYSYRLLAAAQIADELFRPGETIPEGVGERTLRPLTRLMKQDRLSEVKAVWSKAIRVAGGATPSMQDVRKALNEYDPPRRATGGSTGRARPIEFQIRAEFRQLIQAGKYRTAAELINELGSELRKAMGSNAA